MGKWIWFMKNLKFANPWNSKSQIFTSKLFECLLQMQKWTSEINSNNRLATNPKRMLRKIVFGKNRHHHAVQNGACFWWRTIWSPQNIYEKVIIWRVDIFWNFLNVVWQLFGVLMLFIVPRPPTSCAPASCQTKHFFCWKFNTVSIQYLFLFPKAAVQRFYSRIGNITCYFSRFRSRVFSTRSCQTMWRICPMESGTTACNCSKHKSSNNKLSHHNHFRGCDVSAFSKNKKY